MKKILSSLLCAVVLAATSAAFETAVAVTAAAPGAVFLSGEELRFRVQAPGSDWILRNWHNEVIRRGKRSGDSLTLKALPNGYYKLELPGGNGVRTFAVVPNPAGRKNNSSQFFALDSAQSWLARPDINNPRQPVYPYEIVSEVARRSGVKMVRERLHWGEVEEKPGHFNWMQYKINADLLSERGIQVLGMYHYAPQWTRGKTGKLPVNLVATYRFAKKAAETFKGQMTAWEFWNEQDVGFAPEAAWDYAAALKAAYLGFKAADPNMPVAIGGYAITPVLPYADTVMKNGAGEYFDIFNIHTYRAICEFPEVLHSVRAHLKRTGISDRPIWFTENGSNMEGSGLMQSYMRSLKAHSPEQEMLVAEYLPKAMIAMQLLGVSRNFFFVLSPYNESGGNKDWGLMRRDFTVKPGYVAFATLVDQLGNAKPEGEVKLGKGLKGVLYRCPNGSKTLVYWSVSPLEISKARTDFNHIDLLERTFALPLAGNIHGVDLVGTPFTAPAARIPATRYPAFLTGVDALKADIPFHAPQVVLLPDRESTFDKTIIFRVELSDDFKLFFGKDCVDVKKTPARFRLQVWNLSDREKHGTLAASGGSVTGIPASVTLPPFGKTELELAFTPELDREFKGELRIDGVFDRCRTTPLVVPCQSVTEMNSSGRKIEMPQLLDPANWRKNSAGTVTIEHDASEQAIRFTTRFPAGANRWSYPEYTLQLPQESLAGAFGIAFEAKVSKPAAVLQMLLMAVPQTGRDVYLKTDQPAGEYKEHFIAFPSDLDTGKIVKLRLGVNALEDEIAVSVRNIRIFYRR